MIRFESSRHHVMLFLAVFVSLFFVGQAVNFGVPTHRCVSFNQAPTEPYGDLATVIFMNSFNPDAESYSFTFTITHPKDHPAFIYPLGNENFFFRPVEKIVFPAETVEFEMLAISFNQLDADAGLYKSTYSYTKIGSLSQFAAVNLHFRLPHALPWVLDVQETSAELGIAKFSQNGLGPSPSTIYHPIFPFSINPLSPTQLSESQIGIGGLEAFSDPSSELWKSIAFEITIPSGLQFSIHGASGVYGINPVSGAAITTFSPIFLAVDISADIYLIKFSSRPQASVTGMEFVIQWNLQPASDTIVKFRAVLLNPVGQIIAGTHIQTYSLNLSLTEPTERDRVKVLGHTDAVSSEYFPEIREFSYEIRLSKTQDYSTSWLLLSQSLAWENDLMWLGCSLIGADTPTGVFAVVNPQKQRFSGKYMRLAYVHIQWNDSYAVTLKCTATRSKLGEFLYLKHSRYYYTLSNVIVSLIDASSTDLIPPSSYPFITPITTQASIIYISTLGWSLPDIQGKVTPSMSASISPYQYGWDSITRSSSFVLTLNSPSVHYPLPPNVRFNIPSDMSVAVELMEPTYSRWDSGNPLPILELAPVLLATPRIGNDFIEFDPSLQPSVYSTFINPRQNYLVSAKFYDVPTSKTDFQFTFANYDADGPSTRNLQSNPALYDIALSLRSVPFDSTESGKLKLFPIQIPNFQISWSTSPTQPYQNDFPLGSSFDVMFDVTLYPTPLFYPSEVDLESEPSDSLWKLYPESIIYPGTTIQVDLILSSNNDATFELPLLFKITPDIAQQFTITPVIIPNGVQLNYVYTPQTPMTIGSDWPQGMIHSVQLVKTVPSGTDLLPRSATISPIVSIFAIPGVGTKITQDTPEIKFGTVPLPINWGNVEVSWVSKDTTQEKVEAFVPKDETDPLSAALFTTVGSDLLISVDTIESDGQRIATGAEVWYYPVLSIEPSITFADSPKLLQTLRPLTLVSIEPTSVSLISLTATRGYSRIFIRVTRTVTLADNAGEETLVQDSAVFHTVLPKCRQLESQAAPPSLLDQNLFVNTCSTNTTLPDCSNLGVCYNASTTPSEGGDSDGTGGSGSGNVDNGTGPQYNPCDQCNKDNTQQCQKAQQSSGSFQLGSLSLHPPTINETSGSVLTPPSPTSFTPAATTTLAQCECKTGFIGLTCSESEICEASSVKVCTRNNGYATLIPGGNGGSKCDTSCTCYNQWTGTRCQSCGLTCYNSGIAYNDCARCGCSSGFTGNQCQCQSRTAQILLNGYNDVMVANLPLLIKNKKISILTASSATISGQGVNYQYPFDLTETDIELIDMMNELYTELTFELTQSNTGKLFFTLSSSSTDSTIITSFDFTITFGCVEYNNNITNVDTLTEQWDTLVGKFIRLESIQKYFGKIEKEPETTPPTPTPEALPPDDEQYAPPKDGNNAGGVMLNRFSLIVAVCLSIGALVVAGGL